jgi:hypothetical protein
MGGNGGGSTGEPITMKGMIEAESRRTCFRRKPPLRIQPIATRQT